MYLDFGYLCRCPCFYTTTKYADVLERSRWREAEFHEVGCQRKFVDGSEGEQSTPTASSGLAIELAERDRASIKPALQIGLVQAGDLAKVCEQKTGRIQNLNSFPNRGARVRLQIRYDHIF